MSWTEAEQAFAAHFPGYEARLPQRELAEHIEDSLAAGQLIMAEGPTGTGKSFALLVSGIDHARRTNRPVVAGTATKNLQDQYIGDCQTLQEIYYPELRYTVLKGRSNYVCLAKVDELRESGDFRGDLDRVVEAAHGEEVYGDMDRLGVHLGDRERAQLSTSSDECPGKKSCPFGEVCFTERIKDKAKNSHVVIANHALIAIDTTLRAANVNLLPDYSALAIDEAHEFESYVSGAMEVRITERGLINLGNQVAELVGDRNLTGIVNVAAKGLFDRLRRVYANRKDPRETSVAINSATVVALHAELSEVVSAVGKLVGALELFEARTDREVQKRKRLVRRVKATNERVRNVILGEFDQWVRWVEMKKGENGNPDRYTLMQAPLEVAPFLSRALWPNGPATLVSATLSEGGDFHYLAERLGFPESYNTFACPSPFDYATQAQAYIPRHLPDPSREPAEFLAASNIETTELIRAADGRALVLFTSWESLNSAYRALKPVVEALGHKIYKQGEAPPRVLAERFKADEHSVLLATKSFFTGVDIKGDSLRLLVINKLPFPVPNVLFKAQCDAIDARVSKWSPEGSFATRWTPEMIMTLVQGTGRLIRTQTDHGLVAILDPRVYTKPSYGNRVRRAIERSFPGLQLTNELREAVRYLETLDEQAVPV